MKHVKLYSDLLQAENLEQLSSLSVKDLTIIVSASVDGMVDFTVKCTTFYKHKLNVTAFTNKPTSFPKTITTNL